MFMTKVKSLIKKVNKTKNIKGKLKKILGKEKKADPQPFGKVANELNKYILVKFESTENNGVFGKLRAETALVEPRLTYPDRTYATIHYLDWTSNEYISNDVLVTKLEMNNKKVRPIITNAMKRGTFHLAKKTCGYVGSDPEIFVTDKETKQLIPAFLFLNDKKNGTPTGDGSTVYWDGFQAEFETKAESCLAYHCDSVYKGLNTLYSEAKKFNPNATLTLQNLFEIPMEVLQKEKEEFVRFGCTPSYNNYNLGVEGDLNGRTTPYRSAGGHIHLAYAGLSKSPKRVKRIVSAMDAILGVVCVAFFQKYDNPIRRTMYGMAGEYRLPAHGLEYRVLSNAWLSHPLVMHMTFDLARMAAGIGDKDLLNIVWDATEEETIKCIQKCDVKLAQKIIERNRNSIKTMLNMIHYGGDKSMVRAQIFNATVDAFINGFHTIIKDPDDIVGNWKLGQGTWLTHSDGAGNQWTNEVSQRCIKDASKKQSA